MKADPCPGHTLHSWASRRGGCFIPSLGGPAKARPRLGRSPRSTWGPPLAWRGCWVTSMVLPVWQPWQGPGCFLWLGAQPEAPGDRPPGGTDAARLHCPTGTPSRQPIKASVGSLSPWVTHQFAKAPGPLGFAEAWGLWSGICTIAHCLSGSGLQPRDDGHPLGVGPVEFVTSDPLSLGPTSIPTCLQDAQNSDTFPGSWVSGCRPPPDLP